MHRPHKANCGNVINCIAEEDTNRLSKEKFSCKDIGQSLEEKNKDNMKKWEILMDLDRGKQQESNLLRVGK